MSGVIKSIGKTFKKVVKGVGEVVKAIWKPALIAAAAYFTVGMASGYFGDGSLAAKMPGFGEEGIFTKFTDFLGLSPPGFSEASGAESAAQSFALPEAPDIQTLATAGAANSPKLFMKDPFGKGAGQAAKAAADVADGTGGILSKLKNAPFGAYYLGAQALGGIGQGMAQEEQTAEQKREFDAGMAQRNKEFEASQVHPGAFYGVTATGQGAAPQITPPTLPQANTPLTQAQQSPTLSVDDLLKLKQQGVI